MDPEIQLVEMPARRAALLRFASDAGNLDFDIENALSNIWSHLDEQRTAPVGPPFAVFHHMELDTPIPAPLPWDISAGFPVEEQVQATGDLRIAELAACRGARLVHRGDYAGLADAFRLLQAWIEAMGHEAAAPPQVIFHTDPAAVLDSGDWRTELFWALEP